MTAENSPPISVAALVDWLRDARQRTLELVNDLSDEQLLGRRLAIVNPPLWEIGHLGWLQEKKVLRRASEPSVRPDADALYDPSGVPHAQRWDLALPSRPETLAYLEDIQGRIVESLQREPAAVDIPLVQRAVLDEDILGETLWHARQTLGYAAPSLASAAEAPASAGAWPGDAEVPGGTFALGASPEGPCVFDNEKWAHPVELQPFRIARAPVTQSEYAAFVERGGYYRPELWSVDGWRWRQATDARHPIYWRRASSGTWLRRHFDQWLVLEPHRPMRHVGWYEAEAYCQWTSRRLPTEAEWEAAAAGLAAHKRRFPWGDSLPEAHHAHLDGRYPGCAEVAACPAGDSAFGCRQMIGNIWEWTADDFLPYPGFAPDADHSSAAFGTHKVLRGGSWATRARLMRNTFRHFATPGRTDLSTGFRTCAR